MKLATPRTTVSLPSSVAAAAAAAAATIRQRRPVHQRHGRRGVAPFVARTIGIVTPPRGDAADDGVTKTFDLRGGLKRWVLSGAELSEQRLLQDAPSWGWGDAKTAVIVLGAFARADVRCARVTLAAARVVATHAETLLGLAAGTAAAGGSLAAAQPRKAELAEVVPDLVSAVLSLSRLDCPRADPLARRLFSALAAAAAAPLAPPLSPLQLKSAIGAAARLQQPRAFAFFAAAAFAAAGADGPARLEGLRCLAHHDREGGGALLAASADVVDAALQRYGKGGKEGGCAEAEAVQALRHLGAFPLSWQQRGMAQVVVARVAAAAENEARVGREMYVDVLSALARTKMFGLAWDAAGGEGAAAGSGDEVVSVLVLRACRRTSAAEPPLSPSQLGSLLASLLRLKKKAAFDGSGSRRPQEKPQQKKKKAPRGSLSEPATRALAAAAAEALEAAGGGGAEDAASCAQQLARSVWGCARMRLAPPPRQVWARLAAVREGAAYAGAQDGERHVGLAVAQVLDAAARDTGAAPAVLWTRHLRMCSEDNTRRAFKAEDVRMVLCAAAAVAAAAAAEGGGNGAAAAAAVAAAGPAAAAALMGHLTQMRLWGDLELVPLGRVLSAAAALRCRLTPAQQANAVARAAEVLEGCGGSGVRVTVRDLNMLGGALASACPHAPTGPGGARAALVRCVERILEESWAAVRGKKPDDDEKARILALFRGSSSSSSSSSALPTPPREASLV